MIQATATLNVGDKCIDFSGWRDFDAMARLGIRCAMEYVSTSMSNGIPKYTWKSLTSTTVKALHDRGIGIIAMYEAGGTDPLGGYPVGLAHGQQAVRACEALGYPHGLPIDFAVDFDVTPVNITAVLAYLHGARDGLAGLYELGVYGDVDIINACASFCTEFHYAGATSWSHGQFSNLIHLRQQISGSTPNYDNNVVLRPLPMWLPHEVPDPVVPPIVPPEPSLVPISGGSDMPALRQPHTVFDTRQGFGRMPAGWNDWIDIRHPEITSAFVHFTVVNPTAAGWIKVWDASTGSEPNGATVDYVSGVSGTAALVPVVNGRICLKTSAEIDLIIIVQGGSTEPIVQGVS